MTQNFSNIFPLLLFHTPPFTEHPWAYSPSPSRVLAGSTSPGGDGLWGLSVLEEFPTPAGGTTTATTTTTTTGEPAHTYANILSPGRESAGDSGAGRALSPALQDASVSLSPIATTVRRPPPPLPTPEVKVSQAGGGGGGGGGGDAASTTEEESMASVVSDSPLSLSAIVVCVMWDVGCGMGGVVWIRCVYTRGIHQVFWQRGSEMLT